MFTGIIEEIGTVKMLKWGVNSASITIEAKKTLEGIKTGDSINTNGACLTVTSFGKDFFTTDVMAETMRKTNLHLLKTGSKVNLERAMKAGDRFGGHMVSGHIDGTGRIVGLISEDNATWVTIEAGENILKYVVYKGSVAIDGISLTVAAAGDKDFRVSVIPHTSQETTLLNKKAGDPVNIECDVIAKYIEKFTRLQQSGKQKVSKIDIGFLSEHGYIE